MILVRYRIQVYRNYGLKYTIDSLCGLKFRHAVGSLIPAVGLKCINTAVPVLYSVLRPGCWLPAGWMLLAGWLLLLAGWCWLLLLAGSGGGASQLEARQLPNQLASEPR